MSASTITHSTPIPDVLLPHRHLDSFWFAVRVRTRSELRVSAVLECKGYESFAPSYRPACDDRPTRLKSPELALFPGYVFCRFSPRELLPIVTTPDVQNVVSIGIRPEPIGEVEMERMRRGIECGAGLQPHPYLTVGQRVRVHWGALAGIEGVLIQAKSAHRLVISADLLQRAVSLHIDRDCVVPVES
jgi:transcription termination/antitermination protein NusG